MPLLTPELPDPTKQLKLPGVPDNSFATGSAKSTGVPQMGELPTGMSVQGRLDRLLKSTSPYMQTAKQQGLQTANRRGLLNSSIAAGAAQGAAIDRALPIAQQDAGLSGQFGLNQQNYGIQSNLSRQSAAQNLRAQTQAEGFQSGLSSQEAAQRLAAQTQSEKFQGGQSALDRQLQREQQLKQIEAQYGLSRQEAEQRLVAQTQAEGFQKWQTTAQLDAAKESQIRQIQAQFGLSRQEAEQRLQAQTQAESAQRESQIRSIEAQYGLSRQEAEQQLRFNEQNYNFDIGRMEKQSAINIENREDVQAYNQAQALLQGDINAGLVELSSNLQQRKDEYMRNWAIADRDFSANRDALNEYATYVDKAQMELRDAITRISTSPDLNEDAKTYMIQQYIEDTNYQIGMREGLLAEFGLTPPESGYGREQGASGVFENWDFGDAYGQPIEVSEPEVPDLGPNWQELIDLLLPYLDQVDPGSTVTGLPDVRTDGTSGNGNGNGETNGNGSGNGVFVPLGPGTFISPAPTPHTNAQPTYQPTGTQVGGSTPVRNTTPRNPWSELPIGGTDNRGYTKYEFGALGPNQGDYIVDGSSGRIISRGANGQISERMMRPGEVISDQSGTTYRMDENGNMGGGGSGFYY